MTQGTIAIPLQVGTDGKVYLGPGTAQVLEGNPVLAKQIGESLKAQLLANGIVARPVFTTTAPVDAQVWVDYKMPAGSASDPIAINFIEEKLKETAVKHGGQFGGCGGWLKTDARYGWRDMSFIVSAGVEIGTMLEDLKAALGTIEHTFDVTPYEEIDEIELDEDGSCSFEDGSRIVRYDENSDLSHLDAETRAHIEQILGEQKKFREYAETLLLALNSLKRSAYRPDRFGPGRHRQGHQLY